ncbi:hypothetical protein DUZ99_02135 [Xylanibacillus composti]|uniref:Uncharacterized protein n=1 Tax=Xylanibacillus composti TaxID=1572762 RepID=A0A8J4H2A7_9BACL|nr:hypothetical protein [Xylanibacillus composti]MDT9723794.1 hypothetical protein [Xylanibacillus composti]GIQ67433.1 hypothetical protein XYCOK13_02570 [Xylanibacillus composti]
MNIEECIEFLGYRIDRIDQPMLDLSVPAVNGITATNEGLQVNRNRLSKMALPDEQLKQVKRVWLVGIWDDSNARGISVFEDETMIGALQQAVEHVRKKRMEEKT